MKCAVWAGCLTCISAAAQAACLCPSLNLNETLAQTDLAVEGRITQAVWHEKAEGSLPAQTTVFVLKPLYALAEDVPETLRIIDDSHLKACSLNLAVGEVRRLMLTHHKTQNIYHADFCLNRANQSVRRYWKSNKRAVK